MASGFGRALTGAIDALGVVQGEIDNITEAAIRDIGDNVVATMAKDWPLGERRLPSQQGVHSADLWELRQIRKLAFEIRNNADYSVHVHGRPKYGGPPGLAERTVPELVKQIEADPLDFVSDRVLATLGGP